jgi:hypothetical protein
MTTTKTPRYRIALLTICSLPVFASCAEEGMVEQPPTATEQAGLVFEMSYSKDGRFV